MKIKNVVPKIYFTNDIDFAPQESGVWFYSPKKEYNEILYKNVIKNYKEGRYAGNLTTFHDNRINLEDFVLSSLAAEDLIMKNINYFKPFNDGLVIWGQRFLDIQNIVLSVPEFVSLYNLLNYIDLERKEFYDGIDTLCNEIGMVATIGETIESLYFRFHGRDRCFLVNLARIPNLIEYYESLIIDKEDEESKIEDDTSKVENNIKPKAKIVKETLTLFFYLLMRDELPTGKVARIVNDISYLENISEVKYTNKHLAKYSEELASRLMEV